MAYGDIVVLSRTLYKVNDAQLKAMGPNVERRLQERLYQLGRRTRDMARRLAPRKTGALVASIYVTRAGSRPQIEGGQHAKKTTAAYFRAVNAAVRKSSGHKVLFEGEGGTLNHFDPEGIYKTGLSRIGGQAYKTFTKGGFEGHADVNPKGNPVRPIYEFDVPTITPLVGVSKSAFYVTIGAAAYYAGFVEFGHVGYGGTVFGYVMPRPFMTPAMDWAATQINTEVTLAMKEGIAIGRL